MTRLLVSVRDAAEAATALDAGVHLIDVKEPRRGSLGAADSRQVEEVLSVVAGRVPVSAALGELFRDSDALDADLRLAYAKWGLAGAADCASWPDIWRRRACALPVGVNPVAVQYADWASARAPSPRELLAACRACNVQTLLIDTFDKSSGGLLDVWPMDGLRQFVLAARDDGLMIVLGGSLTIESIPAALALAPDYIAVRGAVCTGGRTGPLDAGRVRSLLELLETSR